MNLIFHEALRTVLRYTFTTMEYTDQIYMVRNDERIKVIYTQI